MCPGQRDGTPQYSRDRLNAEHLKHAYRNERRDVYKEIRCCQWSVVIVSPERLVTKSFKDVVSDQCFRKNLCLYTVDEAHVVIPWSKSFRQAYGDIGTVCAHIPPDTPVLAMTATAQHDITNPLLRLLSFHDDELQNIIHRSCEKPNLWLVFQTLTHGLGGNRFPDISWVSRQKYKVIIYCPDFDTCDRVATYLRLLLPIGVDRAHSIRLFNGLLDEESNNAVLTAFNNDPETCVVVATIKFGMGIDVQAAQVVINLGLPQTAEDDMQQKGRAGRDKQVDACGITYIEKRLASAALSEVKANSSAFQTSWRMSDAGATTRKGGVVDNRLNPLTGDLQQLPESDSRSRWATLDKALRRLVLRHVKQECLVAEVNRLFGLGNSNMGADLASHATCVEAKRRLPCSSCMDSHPQLHFWMHSQAAPLAVPLPTTIRPLAAIPSLDLSPSLPTINSGIMGDAPQAPLLQSDRPRLTSNMIADAKRAIDDFAARRWLKLKTVRAR